MYIGGQTSKLNSGHEERNGRDNGKQATERCVKRLRRLRRRVVCDVRMSRRKKHNRTSWTWSSSAAIVWAGRNRNTRDHFSNRKDIYHNNII